MVERDTRIVEVAGSNPVASTIQDLFLAHRERLYAQAYRMLRDPGLALDAVQEAFLALIRAGEVPAPAAWLAEATWRCARTLQRRRQSGPLPETASLSPDEIEKREEAARLWEAVGELPTRMREAVLLRYAQGRGIEETAEAMDISPKAVTSHLSQAADALRARIRKTT